MEPTINVKSYSVNKLVIFLFSIIIYGLLIFFYFNVFKLANAWIYYPTSSMVIVLVNFLLPGVLLSLATRNFFRKNTIITILYCIGITFLVFIFTIFVSSSYLPDPFAGVDDFPDTPSSRVDYDF